MLRFVWILTGSRSPEEFSKNRKLLDEVGRSGFKVSINKLGSKICESLTFVGIFTVKATAASGVTDKAPAIKLITEKFKLKTMKHLLPIRVMPGLQEVHEMAVDAHALQLTSQG